MPAILAETDKGSIIVCGLVHVAFGSWRMKKRIQDAGDNGIREKGYAVDKPSSPA